jgi:uncharacterized protein YbaR (Trm112 family)
LKCDKCGYVSFDHNLACPACKKDLSMTRTRLGAFLDPPNTPFDLFLADTSGQYRSAPVRAGVAREAELDIDTVGDDFEFSLDD